MTLDFDLGNIVATEFGVGVNEKKGEIFRLVTVDSDVQSALQEMAAATRDGMNSLSESPALYEPSEKHASREHIHLPLADELAEHVRLLHQANNLAVDPQVLSHPENVFCYFARMTDKQDRRLTGVRRAGSFKGVLKKRLVRLTTDALKLVQDKVFKLDSDFDLLIDATDVHVLRPSSFEFIGQLQAAVLAAAPKNAKAIQSNLPFVDFSSVEKFAGKHPRAARYLASILSQGTKGISRQALRAFCKANGVEIESKGGKITVQDDQIMGFLEVLDRRRYEVPLVKGSAERFRATSRHKIS